MEGYASTLRIRAFLDTTLHGEANSLQLSSIFGQTSGDRHCSLQELLCNIETFFQLQSRSTQET